MRSLLVVVMLTVPAFADDKLGGPELAAADANDAAYDRGFLTSTAKILAAGVTEVSLRGGISYWNHGALVGVTAGLGHRVEVSFGTVAGPIRGVGGGVKVAVYTRPTWSIAAVASVTRSDGSSPETLALATVRLTTCMFSACQVQVTAGIGAGVDVVAATSRDYANLLGSRASPIQLDGSVMFGTGLLRPLIEGTIMEGSLIIAGVRLATSHVSLDLGVGRATPPSAYDAYAEPTRGATIGVVGIALRP